MHSHYCCPAGPAGTPSSAPTAPGPRPEETAALPPALATLASHLRGSAAGEQLQAMGAMLGNVVSMLQVRAGWVGGVGQGMAVGPQRALRGIKACPHAPRLLCQVGGYTDFEELLSECREEGHAAVEAYLTTQVRRRGSMGTAAVVDRPPSGT